MKRWLGFLCLVVAFGVNAETWRFALIGDTPYDHRERHELPVMLDQIAAKKPAFIVHIGDFKSSNWKCSDWLFRDRKRLFNASSVPFIFVPGDNEWADCGRLVAGHYDVLERLEKLRELFFAEPFSLGQRRIRVEQQSSAYPEHLRWRLGPAIFASLNVPGPNNNFGLGKTPSTDFEARNPMIIEWIKQAFALARRENSAAVILAMQANPGFHTFSAGVGQSGFRPLLETLQTECANFAGQVVLLHGDTHWQRVDRPLRHPQTKQILRNFTRVESYGYPMMGWVEIVMDTRNPSLFHFVPHPQNTLARLPN